KAKAKAALAAQAALDARLDARRAILASPPRPRVDTPAPLGDDDSLRTRQFAEALADCRLEVEVDAEAPVAFVFEIEQGGVNGVTVEADAPQSSLSAALDCLEGQAAHFRMGAAEATYALTVRYGATVAP